MNPSYQRAMILHQQGRYTDAERELRQAIVEDPHDAQAHAMLGLCLAERKAYDEASAEADAAVGLAPDSGFTHYARARVLVDRNRLEEAAAAIHEAISQDTFEPHYFAVLAQIRLGQRRWSDALDAADAGLALDPENAGCVNLRAMALVNLGLKEEAGKAIGDALRRDPQNAVTHANQGWALLHRGQHKQALEHFREALRLDPELDWARSGMVEALKARYLIYRIMLRYFLWMSTLSGRAQWGIIIGGYVGARVLRVTAAQVPELRPLVWPILILYIAFAFLTWLAVPLFNLLLRLNRFGRHALSRDQRVNANWVGGTLAAAVGCLAAFCLTGRADWMLAGVCLVALVFPVSVVHRCPAGWPRTVMGLYAGGMAVLGAAVVFAAHAADHHFGRDPLLEHLMLAFLMGVFADTWLANAMMAVTVKR